MVAIGATRSTNGEQGHAGVILIDLLEERSSSQLSNAGGRQAALVR
jgi:hypothetical protein